MWSIDTIWFDVALMTTLFAVGHIYFGHWEERTPKWRKVLKLIFFVCVTATLTAYFGRAYSLGFLGICLLAVAYIHGIWLPSKGINGWTGEPKDKYYELRGWKK